MVSKAVGFGVGGLLAVLGIAALAIGQGVLPGSITTQINEGIASNEQFSAKSSEALTEQVAVAGDNPSDSDTTFYFYNITNAADVLTGSKPILQEIKVETTKYSFTTNSYFDAAADVYGSDGFSYYEAKDGYSLDTEIITTNLVYFGAAVGQSGSEIGLQSQMIPTVMDVVQSLWDPSGDFLTGTLLMSIALQIAYHMGSCAPENIATCVLMFTGSPDADFSGWPSLLSPEAAAAASLDFGIPPDMSLSIMPGVNPLAMFTLPSTLLDADPTAALSIANTGSMQTFMGLAAQALQGADDSTLLTSWTATIKPLVDQVWTAEVQQSMLAPAAAQIIPGITDVNGTFISTVKFTAIASQVAFALSTACPLANQVACIQAFLQENGADGDDLRSVWDPSITGLIGLFEAEMGNLDLDALQMPKDAANNTVNSLIMFSDPPTFLNPAPDAPIGVASITAAMRFINLTSAVGMGFNANDAYDIYIRPAVTPLWDDIRMGYMPVAKAVLADTFTDPAGDFLAGMRMGAIAMYVGFHAAGCAASIDVATCLMAMVAWQGASVSGLTMGATSENFYNLPALSGTSALDRNHAVMAGVHVGAVMSQPSTFLATSGPLSVANPTSMQMFMGLYSVYMAAGGNTTDPTVTGYYDASIAPLVQSAWVADAQASMGLLAVPSIISAHTDTDSDFVNGVRLAAIPNYWGVLYASVNDATLLGGYLGGDSTSQTTLNSEYVLAPGSATYLDASLHGLLLTAGAVFTDLQIFSNAANYAVWPVDLSAENVWAASNTTSMAALLSLASVYGSVGGDLTNTVYTTLYADTIQPLMDASSAASFDAVAALELGLFYAQQWDEDKVLQTYVLSKGFHADGDSFLDYSDVGWYQLGTGNVVRALMGASNYYSTAHITGDPAPSELYATVLFLGSTFPGLSILETKWLYGAHAANFSQFCNDFDVLATAAGFSQTFIDLGPSFKMYFCTYVPLMVSDTADGTSVFDVSTSVAIGKFFAERYSEAYPAGLGVTTWYRNLVFAEVVVDITDPAEVATAQSYMPADWSEVGWLQLSSSIPTLLVGDDLYSGVQLTGGSIADGPELVAVQIATGQPANNAIRMTPAQMKYAFATFNKTHCEDPAALANYFNTSSVSFDGFQQSATQMYFCTVMPAMVATSIEDVFDVSSCVLIGQYYLSHMATTDDLFSMYQLLNYFTSYGRTTNASDFSRVPADWAQVGWLQLASGMATSVLGQGNSMTGLAGGDPNFPFEFYAFQMGIMGGVVFEPSANEMKMLENAFKNQTARLCTDTNTASSALTSIMPNYSTAAADAVASYFCYYLPLFAAPLGGDSVYNVNTSVAIGTHYLKRMSSSYPEHAELAKWTKWAIAAGMVDSDALAADAATEKARVQAYMPSTATERGYAQWGSGAITQLASASFTSAFHLTGGDLSTVPEFYAWQVQQGVASADLIELTHVQSKAIIDAVLANPAAFCALVPSSPETYSVDATTGASLYTYFCEYLPEALALKSVVGVHPDLADESGTIPGIIGGGIFAKLTVQQILHGYNDTLLNTLAPGQAFNGVYGARQTDLTAALAAIPAGSVPDSLYNAGNNDYSKIDQLVSYQGQASFEYLTDLDVNASCPMAALWNASDPIAAACKYANGVIEVAGLSNAGRMSPLTPIGEMPDTHEAFVSSLMRPLQFEKTGEVEINTVPMMRYQLDSDWDNTGERATKYGVKDEGFIPVDRTLGMVPMSMSPPRQVRNAAERAKVAGLTASDWETAPDTDFFVDIEPYSGLAMNGAQRLQFNLKIEKARMNGMYRDMYTGGVNATHFYMPVLWFEEVATIARSDAMTFSSTIYGGIEGGNSLVMILTIAGALLLVIGLALIGLGAKGGSAGVAPKGGETA